MKITIESTPRFVTVSDHDGDGEIICRVWEGSSEAGVKVQCLIPRIAAAIDQDLSQFDRELQEHAAPSAAVLAFPLRMIL